MLRLTLLGVLALGSAYGAPCDRACLKTTLDQYLTAVVQHKPASAPLSVGFRQTENAMVRKAGHGPMGKLPRAWGSSSFDFSIPRAGKPRYFGTLDEMNGTAIVTLRLKVEDRKITEAEWVLARKGDPGLGPLGGGQANAAYNDVDYLLAHAPGERSRRKPVEFLART